MDLIRSRHEATGVSDAEANDVYSKLPSSPFRKVLEYDLERRKMLALREPKTEKNDGFVEGLSIAIAILNQKPK